MKKAITELKPDPRNRELFDAAEGEDFKEMVESVRQHGLINAITITPDGLIIAGEERWKAAKAAGLQEVPVTIRKVKDNDEIDSIRITENLRRRALKPSVAAKAVRRLYEIHHVSREQGRPKNGSADTVFKKRVDLAREAGMSVQELKVRRTLSDLTPALSQLLDDEVITQRAAYQFAQLPEEDQSSIAKTLGAKHLSAISDDEAKSLKRQLESANKQIAALESTSKDSSAKNEIAVQKVRREMEEKFTKLEREKKEAIAKAKEEAAEYKASIDRARKAEKEDGLYNNLRRLRKYTKLRPEEVAEARVGFFEETLIDLIETSETASEWLKSFAISLRRKHNLKNANLRSV